MATEIYCGTCKQLKGKRCQLWEVAVGGPWGEDSHCESWQPKPDADHEARVEPGVEK